MFCAFEKNDVEREGMSEEEKIALFDAYLRNEMSESDSSNFTALSDKSEDFRNEFEAYKSDSAQIKSAEEYGQIRSTLKSIHQEIHTPKKSLFVQMKFWIPLAAAAVVAIVVFALPTVMGGNADTADNAAEQMVYLENDDVADGASEEASEEALVMTEEIVESDSSTVGYFYESEMHTSELNQYVRYSDLIIPKGTCFPISNQGYFLTAKHLVHKRRYVKIQQKDLDIAFNTEVVYRDSVLDFAILKCSEKNAELISRVPFKMVKSQPSLGDNVFSLGYPKADIVYTKGDVSSENGFRSDSMTYQISMPANPGNSGAPLFTKKGDLAGIIIANNSKKQSVTYVIKPDYILDRIENLQNKFEISLKSNYSVRYNQTSTTIKKYRPFVFELH